MTSPGPGGRLWAAADQLLRLQMPSGAWGQRPDSERGNTIATAQALTVLQRAGIPGWHEAVGRAGRYLAEGALVHAKEVEEGGRGPYVRYVIHSLAGLWEFADGLADEQLAAAREAQLEWLLERQTYGGWADSPPDPISTLATAQALQVLRRAGAPAPALAEAARYLMDVRSPRGYWQVNELGPQSPGVTAQCMLALRGLSAEIDAQLALSARWLEANRRLWLRRVERLPISGETWQLASFALAEQALAPYGAAAAGDSGSLEYVEELWDPEGIGWRFPGELRASPKGAATAVRCFEAVLGAAPLDAAAAALTPAGRGASPQAGETWEVELLARPDAQVRVADFEHLLAFRPRLWDLLDALERESRREDGGFLPRGQIAATVGLNPGGSLSKEMTRLNEFLAKQTRGRLNRVVAVAGPGRWRLTGRISRRDAAGLLGSAAPGPSAAGAADG